MENLLPVVEGLLFAAGEEGLSLIQLQSVLCTCSRDQIKAAIQTLKENLNGPDHGICLMEYAGRYKLITKEEIYPWAQALFQTTQQAALSAAAMETLAIIAYQQPITRAQIEEIRGVGSDAILKKLAARGLIEAKDRLDAVGRPLLYTVTDEFMDAFSLESLDQLPELEQPAIQDTLFEDTSGKEGS